MGGRGSGGGSDPKKSSESVDTFSEITRKKHFDKHAKDYNAKTINEYESIAVKLRDSKEIDGIHSFTSKGGLRYKYDEAKNDFLMYKQNGELVTFFKPERKMDYWKDQVANYGS